MINEMKIAVDQTHPWALSYDRKDGVKDVVFQTFIKKPNAEDIRSATDAMSKIEGYEIEPILWGPV